MADRNAAFCQQILNVPQAEGETVVGPNGLANDRAWKAIALQGRGGDRQYHLPALASQIGTGNLTIPFDLQSLRDLPDREQLDDAGVGFIDE